MPDIRPPMTPDKAVRNVALHSHDGQGPVFPVWLEQDDGSFHKLFDVTVESPAESIAAGMILSAGARALGTPLRLHLPDWTPRDA